MENDLGIVFPPSQLSPSLVLEDSVPEQIKISVPGSSDSPLISMGIIGTEEQLLSLDTAEYTLRVVLKNGVELEYTISVSKTEEERRLKEYSSYIKSMVQGRLRGVVVATADGRLAFISGDAVAVLELR